MKNQGFSLIELMVAVAIVAILAGVAYPGYKEQVSKGRRSDAQAVLAEASQFMERWYSQKNRYGSAASTSVVVETALLPSNLRKTPRDGGTTYYQISVETTDTSYTLKATAKGSMASDKCGNFSLTHTGEKKVSTNATDCWAK